jgi:hypothetical protein
LTRTPQSAHTDAPRIQLPLFPYESTRLGDQVVVDRDGVELVLDVEGMTADEVQGLLARMDGATPTEDLVAAELDEDAVHGFLAALDGHALLDDATRPQARSGLDVLLELEDLSAGLERRIMYHNEFWAALRDTPQSVNPAVFYGFTIENYHFLHRESYFDSPVLSYQASTGARLIMNEFYREEYGHDELILCGLNAIGITREDLADTMPLPGTMAMCNALAYWAMTDPIFFFSTLGILEGNGIKEGEQDFFLDACDAAGVDPEFVGPVRAHARINRDGGHGNLTRAMFRQLPCIDGATVRRLRSRTYLFFDLYDAFYRGVYRHYSTAPTLLRRVSNV